MHESRVFFSAVGGSASYVATLLLEYRLIEDHRGVLCPLHHPGYDKANPISHSSRLPCFRRVTAEGGWTAKSLRGRL
jgi:hypothetical protein